MEMKDELCEFVDALDVNEEKSAELSDRARDQQSDGWNTTLDTWSVTGEPSPSEMRPVTPEPTSVDAWTTTTAADNTWSVSGEPSPSETRPVTPEPTSVDAWTTTTAADNTWLDITATFDDWLMRLVDIERRISTGKSLKGKHISQSIDGMLQDGLIGYSEASELRYIGHCWTRLMNAHTLYTAGCHSYKYDILSTLLDLYSAKQITKELCIDICEQL